MLSLWPNKRPRSELKFDVRTIQSQCGCCSYSRVKWPRDNDLWSRTTPKSGLPMRIEGFACLLKLSDRSEQEMRARVRYVYSMIDLPTLVSAGSKDNNLNNRRAQSLVWYWSDAMRFEISKLFGVGLLPTDDWRRILLIL